MKKYLLYLPFLAILGLFIVFNVVNSQVIYSNKVIIKFAETLKEKNINSLIPFLANEPEYVSKKSMEEFRKIYNFPEEKIEPASHSVSNVSGFTSTPRKYSGKELVEEIVPIDIFFGQNRFLKEIVSFKEKGKEARARVKFGGKDSQTQELFGDIEYDIFLYKENDGWKIFKINRPNQNEKYDIYKFYAVSNNP